MRNFLICLLAVLALTASPSFAQPDIVKRPVQSAKGKSGATIEGSQTGDQTVDYTLRAAAGPTMGQCDFGVARSGGGTAAVAITRPDGRQHVIFFKAGKAVGANLSQADGDMGFGATQEADLHMIRARYEIPEAVINGG